MIEAAYAWMEHVNAVLRVRSLLAREVERGEKTSLVVQPDGRGVQVTTPITRANKKQVQMFDMDRCLSPEIRQKEIFEALEIGKMCDAAFEGKAATVMCFGQTGSGKTYTMSGPSGDSGGEAMESGIQFEAARYVAEARKRLLAVDDGGAKTVTVRTSYIELFNERINDMLNGTEGLKCRWAKDTNCFLLKILWWWSVWT
ncbi:hypothetical protein TRVL_08095 [Trypanosoma vivax]|nr:hypothetical protein TRVL_08095 [Trypanosoma vivax]